MAFSAEATTSLRLGVFAAVQLSCGAASLLDYNYELPDETCRTPARFEISADDFLYSYAETLRDQLLDRAHEVEFSTTPCSGHCCGGKPAYGHAAWNFFAPRIRCPDLAPHLPPGCGTIGQLP